MGQRVCCRRRIAAMWQPRSAAPGTSEAPPRSDDVTCCCGGRSHASWSLGTLEPSFSPPVQTLCCLLTSDAEASVAARERGRGAHRHLAAQMPLIKVRLAATHVQLNRPRLNLLGSAGGVDRLAPRVRRHLHRLLVRTRGITEFFGSKASSEGLRVEAASRSTANRRSSGNESAGNSRRCGRRA